MQTSGPRIRNQAGRYYPYRPVVGHSEEQFWPSLSGIWNSGGYSLKGHLAIAEFGPVPGDGFPESFFHPVAWRPVEQLAGLGGVEVLLADFGTGGVLNDGFEVGAVHDAKHHVHNVEDSEAESETEVEGLAGDGRRIGFGRREAFAEREIALGGILDVEEVADEFAVAADDEALAVEGGLNDSGDGTAEVEVAAAEKITAAGDCGLEAVSGGVHLRDEVGAGFRNVVRIAALERMRFKVGEARVRSVGLVGRGDNDVGVADEAAGFEDVPSACDVGAESPDGIEPGDLHERLRGEMEDGMRLILGDDAAQGGERLNVTVDDDDLVQQTFADEDGARGLVADERDDFGAFVE